eukprot:scaffold61976_cov35-Cyclotella_meneghiniana.AAC.4
MMLRRARLRATTMLPYRCLRPLLPRAIYGKITGQAGGSSSARGHQGANGWQLRWRGLLLQLEGLIRGKGIKTLESNSKFEEYILEVTGSGDNSYFVWDIFYVIGWPGCSEERDSNTEGVLCRRGEYRVWRPDTASIHTRLCGGWVLPKPRLVGCGCAATQVGSLSRRGLGYVSNTSMKAEEEEPRSSART